MTRKFFISQMALLASSKEIPETLAGHAGNMTEAYRRYPVKQLAAEYLKTQHLLTIAEESDLKAIETGFKNQLQKHDGALAAIVIENSSLKEQLASMQHAAAGHTNEISELREQTLMISKLVEQLMSENVKTQFDKEQVHGATVLKSLFKSPRK
jgi:hypothetical protein